MKCIFCKENISKNDIINHYENVHNIDKTNKTLLSYISSLTSVGLNINEIKSCEICDEILDNSRQKAKHLLLKHYKLGQSDIDTIPIVSVVDHLDNIDKHIFISSIFRSEHYYEYDWSNIDIIDTFYKQQKYLLTL